MNNWIKYGLWGFVGNVVLHGVLYNMFGDNTDTTLIGANILGYVLSASAVMAGVIGATLDLYHTPNKGKEPMRKFTLGIIGVLFWGGVVIWGCWIVYSKQHFGGITVAFGGFVLANASRLLLVMGYRGLVNKEVEDK